MAKSSPAWAFGCRRRSVSFRARAGFTPARALNEASRADEGTRILDDDEWISCTPPAGGASFFPLTPCRLVDTRNAVGPRGGPALTSGAVRPLVLSGVCGVPASARALAVNVTVTAATSDGFVHFAPGGCSLPLTSTVNFRASRARANNAILTLALDGSGALSARAFLQDSGRVHLILDVMGYFQ